ncbi:MAG: coenzyme F420-0:L-glutamate ligase [Eubacteriales bacterium]
MIAGRISIKTHVVTENDNIVDVVKKYAGPVAAPGDIIAVAESVVAISQGRAIRPETVKAGYLAHFLCRFPGKDGSLAAPESFQVAIEQTGAFRILLGVAAAGIGRIVGRRGDFYRVAGRHLAQIDDYAGSMWPYDRHIVLGPKEPEKVAEAIKQSTGAEAAIVDVNDIGKVDILAATGGVEKDALAGYLKDNPHGNDDEQTPIVVLVSTVNLREIAS